MLASPPSNSSLLQRVFVRDGKLHPAWRVALYLLVGFVGSFFVQFAVTLLYVLAAMVAGGDLGQISAELASSNIPQWLLVVLEILGLGWVLLVTWAFRRWLDKAPLRDLGFAPARLGRETLWGLGLGLASMLLILAAHLALGWADTHLNASGLSITGTLGVTALVLVPAAAIEEIIFRGYFLQTLENWPGWRPAAIISSLFFGLAHIFNPAFGFLPFVNIVLAGLLFALLYRLTRRLWLPIAYHFMWNFAQGPLFGFPVSGLGFGTILKTEVHGPAVWTGGAFGPEGGLIVTGVLALLIVALGAWDKRQQKPMADSRRAGD